MIGSMSLMPLIFMSAGALVVLVLMAVAFAGPSPERARTRRLGALKERHSSTAAVAVEAQLRKIGNSRTTRLDSAATRMLPNPALLKKRLAMTGKSWTLGQYALVSAGLFVVSLVALWVRGAPPLLALFGGLLLGLGLPHKVVGSFIKRRGAKFVAKFPDAIELLVRGLRSGLPISETMNVVGNELRGPVGEEFRAVSDKMKIGRTMDAALQETADRLGMSEFQFFVISIAIQRETGGNLAETLSNLATVLRQRSQMKLKVKAMSSESKASAYIVGSLPFIVFGLIYTINANYMQNFFIEPRLIATGLGALVWMSLGVLVMAKMVNFEI